VGGSRNSLFFGNNPWGRQLRRRGSSGRGKYHRKVPVDNRPDTVIPGEILWDKVGLDQHRRTAGMEVGCMPSYSANGRVPERKRNKRYLSRRKV
jgi:hypothetical protein